MPTPDEIERLMQALEPFTRDARKAGFEDGRTQGILSVYAGILRMGMPRGGGPLTEENVATIRQTDAVRVWMEATYPIIRETYPDQPSN